MYITLPETMSHFFKNLLSWDQYGSFHRMPNHIIFVLQSNRSVAKKVSHHFAESLPCCRNSTIFTKFNCRFTCGTRLSDERSPAVKTAVQRYGFPHITERRFSSQAKKKATYTFHDIKKPNRQSMRPAAGFFIFSRGRVFGRQKL